MIQKYITKTAYKHFTQSKSKSKTKQKKSSLKKYKQEMIVKNNFKIKSLSI